MSLSHTTTKMVIQSDTNGNSGEERIRTNNHNIINNQRIIINGLRERNATNWEFTTFPPKIKVRSKEARYTYGIQQYLKQIAGDIPNHVKTKTYREKSNSNRIFSKKKFRMICFIKTESNSNIFEIDNWFTTQRNIVESTELSSNYHNNDNKITITLKNREQCDILRREFKKYKYSKGIYGCSLMKDASSVKKYITKRKAIAATKAIAKYKLSKTWNENKDKSIDIQTKNTLKYLINITLKDIPLITEDKASELIHRYPFPRLLN
eukprot:221094_1